MHEGSLAGRTAVVTGGSRGFGLAVARAFAAAGSNLLLSARAAGELAAAQAELRQAFPGVGIEVAAGDVANESDVLALEAAARAAFGGVDALVCNAGVYGPMGPIESLDWKAWVDALHVNLVGLVFCARVFAPMLKASARGKVILLSGGGATKPLPFLSSYAASKAAVVRFGETLAEEWKPYGIDVNMVAPGALNTRLLDEVLAAGPEIVGPAFFAQAVAQRESGGTALARGANLCTFLAGRRSDGITGRLISAVWDPWERLPELSETLAGSDIYTLRRIVPKERGHDWQ